jgi:glutathione S-transferase
MKIFYSPRSPFVRKVLVLAIETGLDARIERIPTDSWQLDPALIQVNPLGKVPALLTDDGTALYDSPVICEYLDGLHNGPDVVPHTGMERLRTLRIEALADGIMESTVLRWKELIRPAGQQSAEWAELQRGAVERGLDVLDRESSTWANQFQLGQITAACALGYLDFRFSHENWRASRPALAEWYARVAQRSSLKNTEPKD